MDTKKTGTQMMWDYIVEVTKIRRDIVKQVIFCMVYGTLNNQTLFDLARFYRLDITMIANIRGAADEWLTDLPRGQNAVSTGALLDKFEAGG